MRKEIKNRGEEKREKAIVKRDRKNVVRKEEREKERKKK
jgi:hypothetical protein